MNLIFSAWMCDEFLLLWGAGRGIGGEQGNKTREPPPLCRAGPWGQPGLLRQAQGVTVALPAPSSTPLCPTGRAQSQGWAPRTLNFHFFRFFSLFFSLGFCGFPFLSPSSSIPACAPVFPRNTRGLQRPPKACSSLELALQGGQEDPDRV